MESYYQPSPAFPASTPMYKAMAHNNTIIPPALRPGDQVAFISPSLRLNAAFPTHLSRAASLFESLGYTVVLPPAEDPALPPGSYDAELRLRRDELHAAFLAPRVRAIVCTVGGAFAHELLPHLDYGLIRARPKIVLGFSDVTALHCALYVRAGLRSFYGPMAIDPLGGAPGGRCAFDVENLLRVIAAGTGTGAVGQVPRAKEWSMDIGVFAQDGEEVGEPVMRENAGWRWLRAGRASGRILGGCLEPLMNLPGTAYWPDFQDSVLLVETSLGEQEGQGVSLEKVRAQMGTLRNLDVFAKIRGMVVGRPFGYDEEQRGEFDEIIRRQTRGFDFPILIDVDVGHTSPILTVPLGGMVSIDSEADRFSFDEPSVVE